MAAWDANPVVDASSSPPDASESPPFFKLVVSDPGVTSYTMSWSELIAGCGSASTYISVTGTNDSDYISVDTNKIRFNFSSLANRDVVTDVYMLPVTITARVAYDGLPETEISYQFAVKEYDCRPQTSPGLMSVFANFDLESTQTYSDFET